MWLCVLTSGSSSAADSGKQEGDGTAGKLEHCRERDLYRITPMSKTPPRPAAPDDAELAEPHPDEETEIGKANKLAEKNKKPGS
jgi:hypothetical protein